MSQKNINDLTLDIMQAEAGESLGKALPPRIAYRLRQWFRRQGRRVRITGTDKVAGQIAQKMEEVITLRELKKNQFMARVHDDGVVKMDFGSAVPDKVRLAAMNWAKRRGLKPVEASLAKTENGPYSVTYLSQTQRTAESKLLAQYVWEISEQ